MKTKTLPSVSGTAQTRLSDLLLSSTSICQLQPEAGWQAPDGRILQSPEAPNPKIIRSLGLEEESLFL